LPEGRPALALTDVRGVEFDGVRAARSVGVHTLVTLGVTELEVHRSTGLPELTTGAPPKNTSY
jgi:hypothetical protein